jgi:hypothetical protein
MTAQELSLVAGILLSLFFTYIPKANTWFAGLGKEVKQLFMLGLLALAALGSFGLACAGVIALVTCDKAGAIELATAFILAVVANQSTHRISPEPKAVREVKARSINLG